MIRRLWEEDIDAVMGLWLDTNIQAHGFIDSGYWQAHYSGVRTMLPQADVYVYEQEQEILGFIGLTGAYIAGIFVAKAWQSQGIGGQLLQYVKEKHDRLTLSVYEKNRRAVDFYLRKGFLTVNQQTDDQTGEKELMMEWNSPA